MQNSVLTGHFEENHSQIVKGYLIKVEHGCAVATVGGSRGVLVVGGATGMDIQYLDIVTDSFIP